MSRFAVCLFSFRHSDYRCVVGIRKQANMHLYFFRLRLMRSEHQLIRWHMFIINIDIYMEMEMETIIRNRCRTNNYHRFGIFFFHHRVFFPHSGQWKWQLLTFLFHVFIIQHLTECFSSTSIYISLHGM